MIKAIVVDMDGTFLNSKHNYNREWFKEIYQKLSKQNIRFVVASGNQYAQLKSFFPESHENISFIAENGALIFEQNTLIREHHFEIDLVGQIITYLKDTHPDVDMILCGIASSYIEKNTSERFKSIAQTYYHKLQEVAHLQNFCEDKYVKFALSVPVSQTEQIQDSLQTYFGHQIVAVSSGHGSVDIIIPGKHKANGLSFLAAKWGISPEDIVAFGDGNNDVEMLQYVGHSYAMENGSSLVKEASKYSAPSNDESGVLQIIETYL